MFKSQREPNRTLTTLGHGMEVGDVISFGDERPQVIVSRNGNTFTFRDQRWYEKLWAKVKNAWHWRERREFNRLCAEAEKAQKQRDIERDILNAEVIGE